MVTIKEKVFSFLNKYGLDYHGIDMEKYCQIFIDEMIQGLKGKNGSLPMLATYIEVEGEIPLMEKVIVLDAGGTNFRVATVYFDRNRVPVIENFKKYPMPGIDKEIDKESFFTTMAEYMKDVAGESQKIGFCFSYPTQMYPDKDGRVIQFSKEVKAKSAEGEMIGENLKTALQALGLNSDKKVVVLNDTVATLLAGKADSLSKTYDGYIGFILGTGTNCCYIEQNANILKIEGLEPERSQVINIESGSFGKAPLGPIDLEFDKSTVDPGQFTYEKMVSGRYLGAISLRILKQAAKDGLFSGPVIDEINKLNTVTTIDVNKFLSLPGESSNILGSIAGTGNRDDRATFYYLLDAVVERSAKLAAIGLSAVALKSGRGKTPDAPICITAEGTTFYQMKSLKSKTEYYLKEYLAEKKDCYIEFVSVENATLIGAAIAGLMN